GLLTAKEFADPSIVQVVAEPIEADRMWIAGGGEQEILVPFAYKAHELVPSGVASLQDGVLGLLDIELDYRITGPLEEPDVLDQYGFSLPDTPASGRPSPLLQTTPRVQVQILNANRQPIITTTDLDPTGRGFPLPRDKNTPLRITISPEHVARLASERALPFTVQIVGSST